MAKEKKKKNTGVLRLYPQAIIPISCKGIFHTKGSGDNDQYEEIPYSIESGVLMPLVENEFRKVRNGILDFQKLFKDTDFPYYMLNFLTDLVLFSKQELVCTNLNSEDFENNVKRNNLEEFVVTLDSSTFIREFNRMFRMHDIEDFLDSETLIKENRKALYKVYEDILKSSNFPSELKDNVLGGEGGISKFSYSSLTLMAIRQGFIELLTHPNLRTAFMPRDYNNSYAPSHKQIRDVIMEEPNTSVYRHEGVMQIVNRLARPNGGYNLNNPGLSLFYQNVVNEIHNYILNSSKVFKRYGKNSKNIESALIKLDGVDKEDDHIPKINFIIHKLGKFNTMSEMSKQFMDFIKLIHIPDFTCQHETCLAKYMVNRDGLSGHYNKDLTWVVVAMKVSDSFFVKMTSKPTESDGTDDKIQELLPFAFENDSVVLVLAQCLDDDNVNMFMNIAIDKLFNNTKPKTRTTKVKKEAKPKSTKTRTSKTIKAPKEPKEVKKKVSKK